MAGVVRRGTVKGLEDKEGSRDDSGEECSTGGGDSEEVVRMASGKRRHARRC